MPPEAGQITFTKLNAYKFWSKFPYFTLQIKLTPLLQLFCSVPLLVLLMSEQRVLAVPVEVGGLHV